MCVTVSAPRSWGFDDDSEHVFRRRVSCFCFLNNKQVSPSGFFSFVGQSGGFLRPLLLFFIIFLFCAHIWVHIYFCAFVLSPFNLFFIQFWLFVLFLPLLHPLDFPAE